jgi:hypothetical protein
MIKTIHTNYKNLENKSNCFVYFLDDFKQMYDYLSVFLLMK